MLATAMASGCIEDPNSVGGSIIPVTDAPLILIDTIRASSHTVSRAIVGTGSSNRLMIGKYQSYESWGLLEFPSLPDSLVTVSSVTSAKIVLYANYHFGADSLSPISFYAYRMLQSWQRDSLTFDSLKTQGGAYYNPTPVSPQVFKSLGDTEIVEIPIDTAMVRSWLNAGSADTSHINNGVLFIPTNTNLIKGFGSMTDDTSRHPSLVVNYVMNGQSNTYQQRTGLSRFAATVDVQTLVQSQNLIYVQNGISYRGFLNFSGTAPVPAKAAIHKAELIVTANPPASKFNGYTSDSLYAYFVDDKGAASILFALSQRDTASGQKIYRFEVQQFVQRWVRGTVVQSIALGGFYEPNSLDLFTLYGATYPVTSLRPRIIITYSPTR